MVSDTLSAAGKECRPRKRAPPRVSGLNFETPAYVRATRSLRSLKHGAAASRRRSQNFPLRSRPGAERARKLHQCRTYCPCSADFIFDASVSHTPMRPHIENPYVSLIYERFYFWHTIPWSATFPTISLQKRMESRQRKKMPPRHYGLKISPVTTLRATRSLRSLRQALRLTPPAKFSPFGHRPPFKGAGKLDQYWTCFLHEVWASCSMHLFLIHRCRPT